MDSYSKNNIYSPKDWISSIIYSYVFHWINIYIHCAWKVKNTCSFHTGLNKCAIVCLRVLLPIILCLLGSTTLDAKMYLSFREIKSLQLSYLLIQEASFSCELLLLKLKSTQKLINLRLIKTWIITKIWIITALHYLTFFLILLPILFSATTTTTVTIGTIHHLNLKKLCSLTNSPIRKASLLLAASNECPASKNYFVASFPLRLINTSFPPGWSSKKLVKSYTKPSMAMIMYLSEASLDIYFKVYLRIYLF